VEHGGAGVACERAAPASRLYFVQDMRRPTTRTTSAASRVIDSYRRSAAYMTTLLGNRERLRELGLDAELIPRAST